MKQIYHGMMSNVHLISQLLNKVYRKHLCQDPRPGPLAKRNWFDFGGLKSINFLETMDPES